MLKQGQSFDSVSRLLRALRPGQRVVLYETPKKYNDQGDMLAMNSRTLRNAVSKANRGTKPAKFHDFYRVQSIDRLHKAAKAPQLAVRYGQPTQIRTGMGERRSLVITGVDPRDLEPSDDYIVSFVECIRRAEEDTREARQYEGELLSDEFFVVKRMDPARIEEFTQLMEKRRQDSANESMRTFGITEVLATIIRRLPTARLVPGDVGHRVQLPIQARWVNAASEVYGAVEGVKWYSMQAAIDKCVAEQKVNHWFDEHVTQADVRWCDFSFALEEIDLGNGRTFVLSASYRRIRALAEHIGVPLTAADAIARKHGIPVPDGSASQALAALNYADEHDDQGFSLLVADQSKDTMALLRTLCSLRRHSGVLSRSVHVESVVVAGTTTDQELTVSSGATYYASVVSTMTPGQANVAAWVMGALEDYDKQVRQKGDKAQAALFVVGHAAPEQEAIQYVELGERPQAEDEVPVTGMHNQPVDPVWLEGCDESLTVPTEERVFQAWDGIGVWCRTDGRLIRRAVFSLAAHEDALSDAQFEAQVRADLARRNIAWPW